MMKPYLLFLLAAALSSCSQNDIQARSSVAVMTPLMAGEPYATAKAAVYTADVILAGSAERITRLDATGLPSGNYAVQYHTGRCTAAGTEIGTALGQAAQANKQSGSLTVRNLQPASPLSAATVLALHELLSDGQRKATLFCLNLEELE